jgi:hypothetical protein
MTIRKGAYRPRRRGGNTTTTSTTTSNEDGVVVVSELVRWFREEPGATCGWAQYLDDDMLTRNLANDWAVHAEAELARWIKASPGTRPRPWWGFNVLPAEPLRRRIRGTGTALDMARVAIGNQLPPPLSDDWAHFRHGVPTRWDPRTLMASDPVVVESEVSPAAWPARRRRAPAADRARFHAGDARDRRRQACQMTARPFDTQIGGVTRYGIEFDSEGERDAVLRGRSVALDVSPSPGRAVAALIRRTPASNSISGPIASRCGQIALEPRPVQRQAEANVQCAAHLTVPAAPRRGRPSFAPIIARTVEQIGDAVLDELKTQAARACRIRQAIAENLGHDEAPSQRVVERYLAKLARDKISDKKSDKNSPSKSDVLETSSKENIDVC